MKSFLEYKLNEGLGVPEKIVFDKSFVVNGKASAGISIRDVIVTRKTGFTPYIKLIELTSVGGGGWGPESPRENDMKTIWKGDVFESKDEALKALNDAKTSLQIK